MTTSYQGLDYYVEKQCSTQWRSFLHAFSTEFALRGEPQELRILMQRLGSSMAISNALPPAESLQDLELAMNKVWFALDWGWVELIDASDCLSILHHSAPLKAAFGAESLSWTPALLEGIYGQWFEVMGVDKLLRVVQYGEPTGQGQVIELRLQRGTA